MDGSAGLVVTAPCSDRPVDAALRALAPELAAEIRLSGSLSVERLGAGVYELRFGGGGAVRVEGHWLRWLGGRVVGFEVDAVRGPGRASGGDEQ